MSFESVEWPDEEEFNPLPTEPYRVVIGVVPMKKKAESIAADTMVWAGSIIAIAGFGMLAAKIWEAILG